MPYLQVWAYCFDWIIRLCLSQRSILHLLVKFPSPFCHQDLTRGGRRLGLREEFLGLCLAAWFSQACQLMGRDHRANRRSNLERLQLEVSNRRARWSTSKHLSFHIFWGTHHRSHRLAWFTLTHDSLSKSWYDVDTWLSEKQVSSLFLQSSGLYQHNRPWRGSLYLVAFLRV